MSSDPKKKRKKKKGANIPLICATAAGVMVVGLATAYGVGRAFYSKKFLANTTINGVDVSGMTLEEAIDATGADVKPKELTVKTIDGNVIRLSSADFDYKVNGVDEVTRLYNDVNRKAWFSGYAGETSLFYDEAATYDAMKLEELLKAQNWGSVETKNASIELTDEGYVVNKEVQGNKVTDMGQLCYTVEMALSGGDFDVTLDANTGCYTVPEITSDAFEAQAEACNKVFNMSITYDFDYTTETLTGKKLLELIDMDDTGQYEVDEDRVMGYVEYLAEKYDTFDKPRKFHATLQGDITVEPSSDAKYGWWIDQQQTCDQLVGLLEDGETVDSIDPIYYSVGGYFTFTGVEEARSEKDDIGKTYIEVDLTDQHLWYYKKGKLEYECYIVSGQTTSMARTTLEGVYKLWNKQTNYRMKDRNADGEEWDTKCNYWNNVSLCGIGLHDSTWRGAFGGTIYQWNGSHGCINMPYDGAKYVYDNVELGTPVVMYY